MPPGLRIALKSVGCRSNQEEMGALSSELAARGCILVHDIAQADVIVLNTCSVTGDTEAKTTRLIRSYEHEAPGAKIMLTGCLAQQMPSQLFAMPNTAWVVGNAEKVRIPEILCSEPGVYHHAFAGVQEPLAIFDEHVPDPHAAGHTRFSVKIQEGCDFRCAYCIVPDLRGPSRSASREGVLERVQRARDLGYREMVLTGTHIGQFNGDERRLPGLIADILALGGDFRLRLSSLDPRDATDELFDLIAANSRICRHLHVSVQSLSPDILAAMGRRPLEYDALVERLKQFRESEPFVGLGADLISGFPGETDAHFKETCRAVEQIGFTYAHLFRYSKRPGTPAAVMENQIAESVKTARSTMLREQLALRRAAWVQEQIAADVVHRIIVEHGDVVCGVTGNYISVEAETISASHNAFVDVRLTSYDPHRNRCAAVAADR